MSEPRSSAAQKAVIKELCPVGEPVVDILGLTAKKCLDPAHISGGGDLRIGVQSLDELHLLTTSRHHLNLVGFSAAARQKGIS